MKNRVTQRDKGSFETGQLLNSLPNFKTALKSKFSKLGIFKTGASDLAGASFETGVAEQALRLHTAIGSLKHQVLSDQAIEILRFIQK